MKYFMSYDTCDNVLIQCLRFQVKDYERYFKPSFVMVFVLPTIIYLWAMFLRQRDYTFFILIK